MFKIANQRVITALILMATLFFGGAMAAQARDTKGSDRLVKGAVAGAAVGAITQVVRGRTGGVQVLKGAAVGASVGAAVGAYSDYKQEKDARIDAERRADNYRYDSYRNTRRGNRSGNYYRAGNGNGRRAHQHNGRCRH
jgi:outer membrane lipoprotein SlyB